MPTVNPRVNVTLSPSLDSLVSRMAVLQRVSKSQVLRELLEAAEPALQRAAALMEAASKAHAGVLGELARGLERAQAKAEADLSDSLERMDRVTADLVTVAETVRGRRPRTGAAPSSAAAPVPEAGEAQPLIRPGGLIGQALEELQQQGRLSKRDLRSLTGAKSPPDPPASNRGVKSPRKARP